MNREDIERKFEKSRTISLWAAIFSVINLVLGLVNVDLMFLFGAIMPRYIIEFGRYFSEYFGNQLLFIIGVILAFMGIAIYGLCYALSKKYKAWILVALVLFTIDSLVLILWSSSLSFDFVLLFGIIWRFWVIFRLASGVKAWLDLKKAPLVVLTSQNNIEQYEENQDENSQPEDVQNDDIENIADDKKAERIEQLEELFNSSTDENEKGIIARQLYDLGKLYYWRFIPKE